MTTSPSPATSLLTLYVNKNAPQTNLSMDEDNRLEAVRRYDILDTPPDGAYDRITALAARLFQVPIAIVSIVDSDRIWFKSRYGVDATEVDRDPGLCASAILQNGPYIIEDAIEDARTLTNPLVAGEMGFRFYAAVPLTTRDSFNLGTLCVIDRKPRKLNQAEIENLQDLASMVMDQLELRLSAIQTMTDLINDKSAAEEAHLIKSEFLANLNHELRTPLNAILGFAQLLSMGATPLPPSQQSSINQIRQAGGHLLKLVNEILDLAGIESGKLSMALETLPLFDILQECQAMLELEAQKKGIHLRVSPKEYQYYVHADRTRLKQVLINLLSNAIKYNRVGGSIIVECDGINPKRVRVSVRDSGIGVPPEKLDDLFEPFNRLGQEFGSEEGTGIGLTVTKKLVEMMGGTIGVESTVGVGSVFWIELTSQAQSL